MARMEETRSNTLRRIAGRTVQIEATYDGTQRAEWISDPEGAGMIGRFFSSRWSHDVTAMRGAEQRKFFAPAFGGKAKAYTAARRWIVS